MKKAVIVLFMILVGFQVQAQRYLTKSGKITFSSDTPFEKIEAKNNQVNAALDIGTGDIVFKVLMKSFEFDRALMQEHFNENYVESDKFPNALFKGKVTNFKSIPFTQEGSYDAEIEGDLTIHGVSKHIKVKGTFENKDKKITGKSKFLLKVEDYGIKVPKAVTEKIANNIEVQVLVVLSPL
jgi:polyisoprenoid-binding protein YceI